MKSPTKGDIESERQSYEETVVDKAAVNYSRSNAPSETSRERCRSEGEIESSKETIRSLQLQKVDLERRIEQTVHSIAQFQLET